MLQLPVAAALPMLGQGRKDTLLSLICMENQNKIGNNCCYSLCKQMPSKVKPKAQTSGYSGQGRCRSSPRAPRYPCPAAVQSKRRHHQPALPACCSVTCKRRTPSLGAGTSATAVFNKNIWSISKCPHPGFLILPTAIFGLVL